LFGTFLDGRLISAAINGQALSVAIQFAAGAHDKIEHPRPQLCSSPALPTATEIIDFAVRQTVRVLMLLYTVCPILCAMLRTDCAACHIK